MAKNPLDGISLDDLDLNDPETFQHVFKYADMTDKATASYINMYRPASRDFDPLAEATAPTTPSFYQDEVPVGKKTSIWSDRLKEAQGVQPGLDPENEFFTENNLVRRGADLAARGFEYGEAAANTTFDFLDDVAEKTGLADLPSLVGINQKILPGSALGALSEAFPMGGFEMGGVPGAFRTPKGDPLAPEVRARLNAEANALKDAGASFEEMQAWAKERGLARFGDDVRAAFEKPDGDQMELPLEEQPNLPFDKPTGEDVLRQEAEDFVSSKPADDLPDFRQRELPLDEPPQQRSFDFGEDAPRQKAINARDTGDTVSDDVQGAVDHINEVTKDWDNAPSIEVFDDFDNMPDVEDDAIGVLRPDGSVAISMKEVKAEAAERGVPANDILSAVTYHESLGHHGLSQRFGEGLDRFLTLLYENSGPFKASVDKWRKDNKDEYVDDDNPLARAAEEVFAKMSEEGRISPTVWGKVRDVVKGALRGKGFQLKYSEGELRSILSMAHDATVRGKGRDVAGNGFRYGIRYSKKLPTIEESRAARLQAKYEAEKTQKAGDALGILEWQMKLIDENRQDGVTKYMKRSVGKGSEGPRRGSMSEDEPDTRTTIPNYRSKRNVDDILGEVAPEKTRQSWDEWIDESGKIKMTGRMAEDLLTGADVPQLLAAEEFLLKSANRIFDLSRKSAKGLASEREIYLLGKEIERAKNVSQSIQEVVSNAARILNARKIEIATDKALSDGIRNMLRSIEKGDLNDPDKIRAIAKKLEGKGAQEQQIARLLELSANVLGLPRSIMSSMDLSAPLRQGIFLIGTPQYWKGIPSMFHQLMSDGNFHAVKDEIMSRPTYPLMKRAGLEIAEIGKQVNKREEDFVSSWADVIPGVEASNRAYTGFLNKLRADTFDSLLRQYEEAGIDLHGDYQALRGIADFVNTATGRGSLGKFTQASPILSSIFFSPRLMASRVKLLNPYYYYKLDPVTRKYALKNLAAFGGIATTVLTLAHLMGADVETDPRSSDFAKIQTGNTRYDILGGFGQYLTLASRIATNSKKNTKDEEVELGSRYSAPTLWDVTETFFTNKTSPVVSYVVGHMKGKNPIGEPFDHKDEAIKRFIPMFLQDASDLVKEEGAAGVPMSLPGLFGVGMQTYDVDYGYDAFGRDLREIVEKGEPETDSVALEVQRLIEAEPEEFKGLPRAPASFREDGETYTLTPEQRNEWQKTMGTKTHEYLEEDMASDDYQYGTDQDKLDIINKAHRAAYEDAKADMLNQMNTQSEGVTVK